MGTLPCPRPCGQQLLPLRPAVWTMKSKPSVPRTWKRRSTNGETGAASVGCGLPAGSGKETGPAKPEERSNNTRKCARRGHAFQPQEPQDGCSGRLASHGTFPGAGGPRTWAQASVFLPLHCLNPLLQLPASRFAPPDCMALYFVS